MFTGIIERVEKVSKVEKEGSNLRLRISSTLTPELKVDQSIAHNGVCLTVEVLHMDSYEVVAVEETLKKTNLGSLQSGDPVNIERCMKLNDRLDGHIVQGHVDSTAEVTSVEEKEGSWIYQFKLAEPSKLIVEKGSICINGVSLTAFDVSDTAFSVTIIPYTYEHTNFKSLKSGDQVNLEFDIIGKYVQRLQS
ncbi:MAG: riboflavin synthase [Flavobacteriales bacterium]|nr:riboflavin synthase [Flavobacteriales bacterium]|tara:strand:+ start:497 stop:1075 length:579 start_codon:yes stop_codon:yes gene_type:complete